MKIKTSELTGIALDWAVAKCEGIKTDIPAWADKPWVLCTDDNGVQFVCPKFSTDWAQGGPIVEREKIILLPPIRYPELNETLDWKAGWDYNYDWCMDAEFCGDTPLIAAMRCYVASKLGNEVDIPEELL